MGDGRMSSSDIVYDALSDASLGVTTASALPPAGGLEEGTLMTASAAEPLPGEDAPLPRRIGGNPPTELEALGTARRMAREQAARRGVAPELPESLPFRETSGTTPILSIRAPKRDLWFGHAKADMEDRTVSDFVREALHEYGQTPPGSKLVFVPPNHDVVIVPPGKTAVLRDKKKPAQG